MFIVQEEALEVNVRSSPKSQKSIASNGLSFLKAYCATFH